jgi:hypothetical protein
LVVYWREVPLLLHAYEAAVGWIFVLEKELVVLEYQLAVFVADQFIGELQVAVRALSYRDAGAVVEVDDILPYFIGVLVAVGHDYEGRVDEAIAV